MSAGSIFSTLAFLFSAGAYVPYVQSVLASKAKPTISSWISWGITKPQYDEKLHMLKDAQYQRGIELEEHTKGDHQYHIHVGTVVSLSRRMGTIFKNSEPQEKRAVLQFLLQTASANGKKLTFTLKKPFDAVLALAHQPIGLPDLDSNQDTQIQSLRSYH